MSTQSDTFNDLVCVVAHISSTTPDGYRYTQHLPRFYVERKGNSWDLVAADVHGILARGDYFDVAHLAFSTPSETAIRSVDRDGKVT